MTASPSTASTTGASSNTHYGDSSSSSNSISKIDSSFGRTGHSEGRFHATDVFEPVFIKDVAAHGGNKRNGASSLSSTEVNPSAVSAKPGALPSNSVLLNPPRTPLNSSSSISLNSDVLADSGENSVDPLPFPSSPSRRIRLSSHSSTPIQRLPPSSLPDRLPQSMTAKTSGVEIDGDEDNDVGDDESGEEDADEEPDDDDTHDRSEVDEDEVMALRKGKRVGGQGDDVDQANVEDTLFTMERPPSLESPARKFRRVCLEDLSHHAEQVMSQNRLTSWNRQLQAFAELREQLGAGPLKVCRKVEDFPFYARNIESHERFRPVLARHISLGKQKASDRKLLLQSQYQQLYEQWQRKTEKLDQQMQKRKRLSEPNRQIVLSSSSGQSVQQGGMADRVFSFNTRPSRRGASGASAFTSDSVKSEAEWQEVLSALGAATDVAGDEKSASCAVDPPMITDALEKQSFLFNNDNGRVWDPEAALAEASAQVSLKWTPEEKAIFRSRLIQHGKNFPRIAAFLPNKSTQDCVQYFYREKYSAGFKNLVRRGNARNPKRKVTGPQKKAAKTTETPTLTKARASLLGAVEKKPKARVELPEILPRDDPEDEPPDLKVSGEETQLTAAAALSAHPTPKPKRSEKVDKLDKNEKVDRGEKDRPERLEKVDKIERAGLTPTGEPLSPKPEGAPEFTVRWTVEEKSRALEAFARHRNDFVAIAAAVITKSAALCEEFYMAYRYKLQLDGDDTDSPRPTSDRKKGSSKRSKEKGKSERKVSIAVKKEADVSSSGTALETQMTVDSPEEERVQSRAPLDDNTGDGGVAAKAKTHRVGGEGELILEATANMCTVGTPPSLPSQAGDSTSPQLPRKTVSYWSRTEKEDFVKGIKVHGQNWEEVSKVVGTKTAVQSRNYYRNQIGQDPDVSEALQQPVPPEQPVKSVEAGEPGQEIMEAPVAAPPYFIYQSVNGHPQEGLLVEQGHYGQTFLPYQLHAFHPLHALAREPIPPQYLQSDPAASYATSPHMDIVGLHRLKSAYSDYSHSTLAHAISSPAPSPMQAPSFTGGFSSRAIPPSKSGVQASARISTVAQHPQPSQHSQLMMPAAPMAFGSQISPIHSTSVADSRDSNFSHHSQQQQQTMARSGVFPVDLASHPMPHPQYTNVTSLLPRYSNPMLPAQPHQSSSQPHLQAPAVQQHTVAQSHSRQSNSSPQRQIQTHIPPQPTSPPPHTPQPFQGPQNSHSANIRPLPQHPHSHQPRAIVSHQQQHATLQPQQPQVTIVHEYRPVIQSQSIVGLPPPAQQETPRVTLPSIKNLLL